MQMPSPLFKKFYQCVAFPISLPCLFHETGNKSEKMRKFQKAVMTPDMKVEERAKTVTNCDQFLLNNVDGISQFYLSLKGWHGERAHEG